MTREEIDQTKMTPAWWGRTLYYRHLALVEPIGVVLAAFFTQEGQQPQLNNEITIPALTSHYGFERDSKAIEFFVAHELADQEHSARQLDMAKKFLGTPELDARALECAEEICRLRWASATDLYNLHHLGEAENLPVGVG
jgi:pyrroloquinoline quinone (PQQ) biosynthesis protein C